MSLSTQQIGAAGELLVQYKLLKIGIDSARLTTDAGTDLVGYAPGAASARTIQVKTVERSTPAGGRGRRAIGWTFPHATATHLLAFAVLELDCAWLLTLDEARGLAQQHTARGSRRLYCYTDLATPQRNGIPLLIPDLDPHLLERRAVELIA